MVRIKQRKIYIWQTYLVRTILFFILVFPFFSNAQKSFALVELFTSEGCSSCPPADLLISKVGANAEKTGQNIFLLAYHIDYWNKSGWKDPFSKYQFTLRQENYSRVLPEKEMYTPQAVVNGEKSFTGSKEEKMNEYIKNALTNIPSLLLSAKKDSIAKDTLFISYKISKSDPNFVLRIALTEDDLSSLVLHGENEGKTLHHDYVVKVFSSIDAPGKIGQAKFPLKGNRLSGKSKLVAFVQHKQTMKVLIAERIILH